MSRDGKSGRNGEKCSKIFFPLHYVIGSYVLIYSVIITSIAVLFLIFTYFLSEEMRNRRLRSCSTNPLISFTFWTRTRQSSADAEKDVFFFVFSRSWVIEKNLNPYEESNLRPSESAFWHHITVLQSLYRKLTHYWVHK